MGGPSYPRMTSAEAREEATDTVLMTVICSQRGIDRILPWWRHVLILSEVVR
jgi:hypothetical protein